MKISRQVREIINIVIFLVVTAFLIVAYVVYPLSQTKATMGRYGIDDFNEDTVMVNDPAVWTEAGLPADSFTVESDGQTRLACLYVPPDTTVHDSINGTVFLLHDDDNDRDTMLALAARMTEGGYSVVAYDQRASGRSTAKYHGDGQYEAADLAEVIRHLGLRERLHHPLVVVGFGRGADAAMLTAREETRIDGVVAVNPHLTSSRMLDALKQRHDVYWFPFYRTIMWWWYEIRSGYAAPYRDIDQIEAVAGRTLLLAAPEAVDEPEVVRLRELSEAAMLRIETTPSDDLELVRRVQTFITEYQ
jgi:pimeloyl-ACP methyl ester carboxylesterase